MDMLTEQLYHADYVFLVLGAFLLIFGKRLFWLALAALGFVVGLQLSDKYLALSGEMEYVVAGVAGVAGAVFAYMAKKLAVTVSGFGIGAILAYHLAQPYAEDLAYQIWFVVLVGALLGVCFAAFLANAALVVLSVLLGAFLVTRALLLEPQQEMVVFAVLAVVGFVIQTTWGRKAPKVDDD